MIRALLGIWVAAALLLPAPAAQEAEGDLDIQLLRPTFAPWGLFSTPGDRPGRQWTVRAGAILQYERAPLVVVNQVDQVAHVVSDRLGIQVGGFVTVADGLGVGLSLPIYIQGGDYLLHPVSPVALGDLRFDVVYRLLDLGIFAFAVRSDIHLP